VQEQKRNRIAAALTVNVILLIVVLVAVLVYQMVFMTAQLRLKKEITEEIKRCEKQLDESEDDLEYLKSEDYLFGVALELGYRFPEADD